MACWETAAALRAGAVDFELRLGQIGFMDDRLTNLEVKMSFLERTVSDLDELVREFGRQLDLTRRQMERLAGQYAARDGDGPQGGPEDEVPPHY
jgi:SlyX protein